MKIVGEVPRIDPLDVPEFVRRYIDRDQPVIIRDALADWPALTGWSADGLKAKLGSLVVRYKRSGRYLHPDFDAADPGDMFGFEESPFAEFVERVTTGPEPSRFFLTGQEDFLFRRRGGTAFEINPRLAALVGDMRLPPYIAPHRLYTVWPMFSGLGVRSWLHYDNNACHNLCAQVTGSKAFVLVPPGQQHRLYPFDFGSDIPAYNCSRVNIDDPDLARFPAFAEVEALAGELQPGELLFSPAFWYHSFRHTSPFNASVILWWKPEHLRLNDVSLRWALHELCAAAESPGSESPFPRRLHELTPAERQLLERLDECSLRPRDIPAGMAQGAHAVPPEWVARTK